MEQALEPRVELGLAAELLLERRQVEERAERVEEHGVAVALHRAGGLPMRRRLIHR
jgi:hypothetical protein